MPTTSDRAGEASALETAVGHLRTGRLRQAEAVTRQILAARPDSPDALHVLEVIATLAGRAVEGNIHELTPDPAHPHLAAVPARWRLRAWGHDPGGAGPSVAPYSSIGLAERLLLRTDSGDGVRRAGRRRRRHRVRPPARRSGAFSGAAGPACPARGRPGGPFPVLCSITVHCPSRATSGASASLST